MRIDKNFVIWYEYQAKLNFYNLGTGEIGFLSVDYPASSFDFKDDKLVYGRQGFGDHNLMIFNLSDGQNTLLVEIPATNIGPHPKIMNDKIVYFYPKIDEICLPVTSPPYVLMESITNNQEQDLGSLYLNLLNDESINSINGYSYKRDELFLGDPTLKPKLK